MKDTHSRVGGISSQTASEIPGFEDGVELCLNQCNLAECIASQTDYLRCNGDEEDIYQEIDTQNFIDLDESVIEMSPVKW